VVRIRTAERPGGPVEVGIDARPVACSPTKGDGVVRSVDDVAANAPIGATIASVSRVAEPVRIPAARYTSPEWAAREHDLLWPRVWQVACTIDHVAQPGDFFEYRVGWLSILIVRGDDGALRAFQNVCRHRGNTLCEGTGSGLTELRCGYHRWTWDLEGRLREVPSRKGFGALRNDDFPLLAARVGTWGPLVFVNADPEAEPLDDFLEGVPDDSAWLGLDDFECTYNIAVELPCNWKATIDGFSETYHVQGIHREMLRMTDDVNSPQRLWDRHGKLEQPYGVASPRLRDHVSPQEVWDAFVQVMGTRIGIALDADPGKVPPIPDGGSVRDVLAERVRTTAAASGVDLSGLSVAELLNMQQYNLFPNVTIIAFPDLLQVAKSRPGATPDDCVFDMFAFERRPPGTARARPVDLVLAPGEVPFGLVIDQDIATLQRVQRGLHQPGFTHLTLSGEECRIVNLHRNLERMLG
jgi:choline monooxygenase